MKDSKWVKIKKILETKELENAYLSRKANVDKVLYFDIDKLYWYFTQNKNGVPKAYLAVKRIADGQEHYYDVITNKTVDTYSFSKFATYSFSSNIYSAGSTFVCTFLQQEIYYKNHPILITARGFYDNKNIITNGVLFSPNGQSHWCGRVFDDICGPQIYGGNNNLEGIDSIVPNLFMAQSALKKCVDSANIHIKNCANKVNKLDKNKINSKNKEEALEQ